VLHSILGPFVTALLKRRERRCEVWLSTAVSEFKASSEASELHTALALHLQRIEAAFQLCAASCQLCFLPCTAVGKHTTHSCATDHLCQLSCDFCLLDESESAATEDIMCKEKAGHGGKHICRVRTHTCGLPCELENTLNCRGVCGKEPGHQGACDCGSGNHLCGQPCGLPGCTSRCTVPYGTVHDQHACEDRACPEVRVAFLVAREFTHVSR
jgi:hypothetical protein